MTTARKMTLGVADHLPARRGPPRPPPDAHPPAKEKLSVVGLSAHGESADLPLDNMLAVTFRQQAGQYVVLRLRGRNDAMLQLWHDGLQARARVRVRVRVRIRVRVRVRVRVS